MYLDGRITPYWSELTEVNAPFWLDINLNASQYCSYIDSQFTASTYVEHDSRITLRLEIWRGQKVGTYFLERNVTAEK